MKTSETTKGLSDALAKAQAIIHNPTKDATNPHFKSRYATLDGGLVVIRKALSGVEISLTQATRMEGDVLMMDSRLTFGNEYFQSEYPVIRFPARQQEIGSALTYARRYTLFALVGVAGDDDDDGEAVKVETPAPQDKKSLAAIIETMKQFSKSAADVEKWWAQNKAEIQRLPKAECDEIIAACSARKNSFLNGETE